MLASWKGSIKFGPLLQFGVVAKAADKELKFGFNGHHGLAIDKHDGLGAVMCGGRIRMQPGVCEGCGLVVEKEEIVRGFEGSYPVDDAYLESLELEKSAVMELDGLVPAEQIEPRWFRRSYDVGPEKGAEKAYVLFMEVLVRSGRVAIGKVVMGGRETIVTVRPRKGLLAMELMWWPEELKATDVGATIAGVTLSDQEIKMGGMLADAMATDFDPSQYRNEYAVAVGEYLDSLKAGTKPREIEHRATVSPAKSLEDALAASLAALGGAKSDKKGKKVKAA